MKEVHIVQVGNIEERIEFHNIKLLPGAELLGNTKGNCGRYFPLVRDISELQNSDLARAVELIRKNPGAQAYPYCRMMFAEVYDMFGYTHLQMDEIRRARAYFHIAKDLAERTLDAFDEPHWNNETNVLLFTSVKHIGDTFMEAVKKEKEKGKPIKRHYQNGENRYREANKIFEETILNVKGIFENTVILSIYTLANMYSNWGITTTHKTPNFEELVVARARDPKLKDAFDNFSKIIPYAKKFCEEAAALYALCRSMLIASHPFQKKAELERILPSMMQQNQRYLDYLSKTNDEFKSAREQRISY